ncbi:hypothetical protein [Bacillus sp. ISL-18]|nr:hypothetical protein [Bacillus sp. ISL-18]
MLKGQRGSQAENVSKI